MSSGNKGQARARQSGGKDGLTFTLKKRPDARVDLSPLTPDKLMGLSRSTIKVIKLNSSGQQVTVNELFDVTGSHTEFIHFRRSSKVFCHIGHRMTRGVIEVRGNAGDYLGQNMKGGLINLRGNAGDWVANGMSGGRIDITGDVGNFTGAALPTQVSGMTDGIVTISGNAGDRVGDRMRRGMILILGDAGSYTGSRMIAGTILVLGKSGIYTGYGMKRGTILLGKKPINIPATFRSGGRLKLEFLRFFYKEISKLGRKFIFFKELGPEVQMYSGDVSTNGKGEILIILNSV